MQLLQINQIFVKGIMICLGESEYFRYNSPAEETKTSNVIDTTERISENEKEISTKIVQNNNYKIISNHQTHKLQTSNLEKQTINKNHFDKTSTESNKKGFNF